MIPKVLPQTICLQFGPEFPDESLAGHYWVLDPYRNDPPGSTLPRTVWMVGRKKSCHIQISPKERLFSRIHATIFYHVEERQWSIMDGGSYPSEDDPEEYEYKKSGYGIWVNGKRIRPGSVADGGGSWIEPGDKLFFGVLGSKIILAQDDKDTIDSDEWYTGWPSTEVIAYPSKINATLEEQIKAATPPQNVTMWAAIRDIGLDMLDDAQKPPENLRVGCWKAFLVGAVLGALVLVAGLVAVVIAWVK